MTGAQHGNEDMRAGGDSAPGPLDHIVGFHIRLAHGAVYRHFAETFADLDLTQKQVSVLWLVDSGDAVAQTDLSARLQMDKATTMAIVNRLQARGFLVRGRSATDRRKQTLALTEAGAAALAKAREAVALHEAWLKAHYTPQEVETLVELLSRLHG